MNEHTESPSTIKEVGIHIGYMRDDIAQLKKIMETLPSGFVTKDDHMALDRRVVKLEGKDNLKNTLLWVGLVASAIINVVVIYQLFTGKK